MNDRSGQNILDTFRHANITSGASRANDISTKVGEESAKCLNYIHTLCELGILYKETPFGENRGDTWFALFSRSGFTEGVLDMAKQDPKLILVTAEDLVRIEPPESR